MFKPPLGVLFIIFSIQTCSPRMVTKRPAIGEDFVPRVVNGWPAKLGDVPYQLAFKQIMSRIKRSYRTYCGGVLVKPDMVVSAAHCFEERGSKCFGKGAVSKKHLMKTMVVAGNLFNTAIYTSENENGQWRKLKSMHYPRRYKFPKADISVGFTTKPFLVNANVAPIGYASRFADYTGKCLVSGYGRVSQYETSEVLLLAHLELVRSSRCSKIHRSNMMKFICSDAYLADVGKGDSGGPLVCSGTGEKLEGSKGILVGIVSGNRKGIGSFFTRVSSYSNYVARGRATLSKPNQALIWLCLLNTRNVLSLFCFI